MSQDSALSQLTYKQRKAIAALLTTRTETEAAENARISRRTLVRWLTLDHFQSELQRAQINASQSILEANMRRLTAGQDQALNVLEDVMQRGKPNERRLAATSWMNIYRDLKELSDFEGRLATLEKDLQP
jgi:phage terminase small subunit